MTTTKHNKYTANERTKELGNKTLTPTGDNQHPEATDEKECSSSSVLSPCSTLHPLIVKLKSPTKIAEKLQIVEEEDNVAHKKQTRVYKRKIPVSRRSIKHLAAP